jgi:hypothetical protein
MTIEFVDRLKKGGSLKRSLGMVCLTFTIPKAFGFEAATLAVWRFLWVQESQL